jgi:hypothetical protein
MLDRGNDQRLLGTLTKPDGQAELTGVELPLALVCVLV